MDLVDGLIWYFVFVYTTVLHEAAHAWSALRLGDDTAYRGGQVSLDPTPHIRREPFGLVIVPIVSWFLNKGQWMLGWASAPYDPDWARRYPRRSAWMAMAGPGANLLMAIGWALLLKGAVALPDSFLSVPLELMARAGYEEIAVREDLARMPRVVSGRRPL